MLLEEEETALVEYIKYMGQRGFPLNRQHLRSYVMEIINRSHRESLFNLEKGPSDKWCRTFINSHKELAEKTPQVRDRGRTRMSNKTVMDNFFKKYEETLDNLGLRTKPGLIYNCDETGFVDKQGNTRKVIGEKGRPCIQQQVHTIDHVTAHMCASGEGTMLPTFLIYQKSLPHRPYREDVPRSWMFGVSESGYMDTDLFQIWFKNIFLKYCSKERPVLLLLDNHDSHISIPVIDMARAERVEILAFPAHTTHLLQPLDVNIIGPMKEKMKSLATSMAIINTNLCISKANLPALLAYAIDQTCSPALVKSAFRKSGLIPLNKDAIDKSHLLPEDFQKSNDTSRNVTNSNKEAGDDKTCNSKTNSCSTCGASTLPHPIQAVRKLPPVLQSIFVTPALPSKATKKRRVVTEARVITGDEMLDQLRKKEKEEREKREGIEKRKKEREQKRKERENEKAEKGKKKDKSACKTADLDVEEEEEDESIVCAVCERRDPGSETDDVMQTSWVMCESCDRWFHDLCVTVLDEDFVCDECL
ncbi:uncharacterized protein LOC117333772 [Pecten maximus]|uniref:uncharacterized protein LOC117333772 n=1 Tax=Pecten maximus TaxID=6579 RepID=UPI0014581BFC|nr:uncharacterized protein LOC117333772 [Pecten maximus]